jgi:Bacterial transcriptional activator domain
LVRRSRVRWLAWSLCGVSIALAGAGSVLNVVGDPVAVELDYEVIFFGGFLIFTLVGGLIALRRPGSPIGWLLLVHGLLWQLAGVLAGYANYSLFTWAGSLPGGTFAAWVLSWVWIPTFGMIPFLFLLFPDGRPPARRWWLIVWPVAVGVVLAVARRALAPGPMANAASIPNPLDWASAGPIMQLAESAGTLLLGVSMVGSLVALIVRFRGARGVEMLQLRWLAYAGALVLAAFVLADILAASGYRTLADTVRLAALQAIPVGVGIAVLRHRMLDIDVVISKSVVFGGLAAFVTAVYLIALVGVGAAVGRGVGSNVGLAVVATAVVAVAFQPLRERLERAARRLVFGKPTLAEERAGVAIHCLGAFRVMREGGTVPLAAWQSKKARTLLKILVARRGRSTTRDFLMEALWPEEDPEVVTRRLSVAQATVRVVLDPNKRHPPDYFLVGAKDAMRLDLAHLPVDVERFLAAAAEGLALYRGGRAVEARPRLAAAEGGYDGDFLEEDLYEDWSVSLREEARTTYISVSRALAELAVASADIDSAAPPLPADPGEGPVGLRDASGAGADSGADRPARRGQAALPRLRVPNGGDPSPGRPVPILEPSVMLAIRAEP